jgi:hypothetical protein
VPGAEAESIGFEGFEGPQGFVGFGIGSPPVRQG